MFVKTPGIVIAARLITHFIVALGQPPADLPPPEPTVLASGAATRTVEASPEESEIAPASAEPAPEVSPPAEPGPAPETEAPLAAPEGPAEPPTEPEPLVAPEPTKDEPEVSPFVPRSEIENMRPRSFGKSVWAPGKGLQVATEDGRFSLAFRMRVQFRYELQHDNDEGETEHMFTIRRARIQFKGNVFGKHNKYYLQLAVSPTDMGWTADGPSFTPIRNWEISFDYLRDLTVTVGQMKVPFNRQRVISSGDQQMVDRSGVTTEFNLDREIGVMLSSNDLGGVGYLRYRLGVFNGEGRDAYRVDNLGMLYVARVEVVPTGDADEDWDGDEVDWARSKRPSLSISGSYAFHDRAKRERGSLGSAPLDGGTTNFHHAQADVMLHVAGLSLSGEFQYRKGIRRFGDATVLDDMGVEIPAPRVPARTGVGYYVQAAYLIPRVPVDITARWGQIFGLGDGAQTSLGDSDEVGGGVGWYIARHSLKLQADYFRLRSDSYDAQTRSFTRRSWADGVDQFRLQLQLAF